MSNARQAVTRLTLDMSIPEVQRSFTVTHGDTNRKLEVTLNNGGQPFALPKQWTVFLTGTLPGGDELYETCVVEDGRIIFDFAGSRAVSSEVGTLVVSFDIFDDMTGEIVASPKVWVNVLAGTRRLDSPEALEKLTGLQNFLEKANSIEEELGEHGEKLDEHGEKLEEHGEKIEEQGEELLGHGEDISMLKRKIIQAGTFDVSPEEWSDSIPLLAYVPIKNFGKGTFCVVSPANSETQIEAKKAMLSVQADTRDGNVALERASTGIAPDKTMSFVYLLFMVDNEEEKPRAALIGVDAHGAGTEIEASIEEQVKKIGELEKLKTRRTKVVIDEAGWVKGDVYTAPFAVQGVENGDVVFVVPSDDQTREYAVLTGMRAENEVMVISEDIKLVILVRDLDTEDHNFDLNFTCFVLKAPDESEGAIAVLVGASQGKNAENTGGSSAPGGSEDEQNYDGSFVVEWNDSTRFGIGNTNKDYYTAGTKIDVYPADEKTYRTASAVGLYIYAFTDQAQNDAVVFALNDDAEIPEEALTFNYRVTKTGTSDNPTATLHLVWGGSGGGSGGGGSVDQSVIDNIVERLGTAEGDIDGIENTLDTVIGTDTGKTMRAVAALVIAEALSEAPESLNSLEEIAAWIEAHPEDVAKIVKRIKDLEDAMPYKVGDDDIINNLGTNDSTKVLSAAQGAALKILIDTLTMTVDGKQDKGDYLTPTAADARYAKPSDIPTVPQTLPNPYALTILGKTYTGGKAVSLTAEEFMDAIKIASGGVVAYLDGSKIVLSGNLPDATYTAYYEVDGKLVEIGDLTLGSVTPDPVTYTIYWVVDGKTTTETYEEGETPTFKGSTDKAADDEYTYTFAGWSPEIEAVKADATYTATYTQTAKPVEPAGPTNFADPSSDDWATECRLTTSIDQTTAAGTVTNGVVTNYIEVQSSDYIEATGINFASTDCRVAWDFGGNYQAISKPSAIAGSSFSGLTYDSNSFKATVAAPARTDGKPALIRFSGPATNGSEGVVINIKRNGNWL